jgi:hypothetical protein
MVSSGSPGNNLEIRFPVEIFLREPHFSQLYPEEPGGAYVIARISTASLFF